MARNGFQLLLATVSGSLSQKFNREGYLQLPTEDSHGNPKASRDPASSDPARHTFPIQVREALEHPENVPRGF